MAGPGGKEVGRVSIRVLPDTSAFKRSLERYITRIERSLRIEIPTVIDGETLVSDARRAASAAEKAAEVNLPAAVADRGLNTRVAALAKRLSGREVTFNAEIDRKSIAGTINRVARLAASMRTLALPIGITAAVPTIAALGVAATQAAGSIALLPAVLTSAVAGVAALKIAFSGFGEAMSNMDDPAKFAEAIAKLAPSARETAIAVRDLKPAFDGLRLDVQQAFFQGLSRTVTDLGATYLPVLRDGLRDTSAAFGDMARRAGEAMMRPEVVGAVRVQLDQTAQASRNLAPALGDVLAGLMHIGEAGSRFLPGLATGASDAAASFARWAQSAKESGRLAEIIEQSFTAIQQIGSVLGNVGSIIAGVFRAANIEGAGFLNTLDSGTERLAAWINSVEGFTSLRQIFSGVQAAVGGIMDGLGSVLAAFAVHLGPVIAELGPAIGELARQLGSALAVAIKIVSPLLLLMATFLRDNMTWLGPIIIALGGLVAALMAIGPAVVFITNAANAFRLLAGASVWIAKTTASFVMFAARVIVLAAQVTARVVVMAAQVVARFVVMAVQAVVQSTIMAVQVAAQFAMMAARAVASMAVMAAQVVARWAMMAAGAMARAAVMAAAWLVAMGPIGWVIAAVIGLVALIIANWDRVKAFTISAWNAASAAVSNAWNAIRNAVSTGVSNAVSYVQSLPRKIKNALGNLRSYLGSAGSDLIWGFINGAKSMIGNLLGTVRNMARQAAAAVKGALGIGSPSKVFAELGKWTSEGFARGIERAAPHAVEAAADMARSVARTPAVSPAVGASGALSSSASLQAAVTAGVLAGLDGSRMRVDGDGVAKLVNKTNAVNARR